MEVGIGIGDWIWNLWVGMSGDYCYGVCSPYHHRLLFVFGSVQKEDIGLDLSMKKKKKKINKALLSL
jgi:hypothetical protein